MQTLEINGLSFNASLRLPSSSEGTGILLLHAWWGLNNFVIQMCDMLSQAGFVVLAPDYYQGAVATTIEEAKAYRTNLDRKNAQKIAAAAIDYLFTHRAVSGAPIGVIGFSLGCSFAIEAARRRNREVRAVVLFYGTGGGKFDKTQAAFQGHFAADDRWGAAANKVRALEDRIRSAGQKATFHTYPDTEHWFAESDRPEFNRQASAVAWERTLRFLQTELQ
jgi:carboxymethylenebutenolidase